MSRFEKTDAERNMEQLIGRVLQGGVLIAAAIVLLGGVALLVQHGADVARFGTFLSEPEMLRTLHGVARGVAALDAGAIVQLGLVLLIATPVIRVALTLVAFAVQRDRLYVLVTGTVLSLLLWSILFGR